MSSNDIAVSVRGLSKAYTISHNAPKHSTIGEALLHRAKKPLHRTDKETFWALKDVEFDVKKGDVVGIIGRNGAGKSTLLKVLSQITEPTIGEINLYGRVGSLLEVGTGFHPELTGRENIYLNGAILGMQRKEIARQFDAIVDFAEVEQFLDTPVKRYSSGMYVRLAFAVAAHLNPEILIVDEVLAVGDANFQKKCLGKMGDVSRQEGKTVLFVSHNMAAVRELCTSGLLLRDGTVIDKGDTDNIVAQYLNRSLNTKFKGETNKHGLELVEISLQDVENQYATDSPMFSDDYDLVITIDAHKPLSSSAVIVRIHNDMGMLISTLCTPEEGIVPFELKDRVKIVFSLAQIQLLPGRYTISVFVYRPNDITAYLETEDALTFDVQPAIIQNGMWPYRQEHGIVRVARGAKVSNQ